MYWDYAILPQASRLHQADLYSFHIKPIMRSQMRFENNAVWCECFEAALFDSGVRKAAFYVGGLLLPREVFWKRILAKSRSLRRFGGQCERVHPIMQKEKRLWTASCMDGKHSISLRFLNRTRQNTEIHAQCESKPKHTGVQRQLGRLIESGVKCGVTAALAIWKGYLWLKNMLLPGIKATPQNKTGAKHTQPSRVNHEVSTSYTRFPMFDWLTTSPGFLPALLREVKWILLRA